MRRPRCTHYQGACDRLVCDKDTKPEGRSADKVAVENFLASLDGLTASEAFANARADGKSYGWNAATVDAIARGISKRFAGRAA